MRQRTIATYEKALDMFDTLWRETAAYATRDNRDEFERRWAAYLKRVGWTPVEFWAENRKRIEENRRRWVEACAKGKPPLPTIAEWIAGAIRRANTDLPDGDAATDRDSKKTAQASVTEERLISPAEQCTVGVRQRRASPRRCGSTCALSGVLPPRCVPCEPFAPPRT